MAKTLDQIIARQDYVRLNNALIDRAIELAEIIRKKMNELDLEDLANDNIILEVKEVRSGRNGFSDEYLAVRSYGECEYEYQSLECRGFYYACGNDFNCPVQGASSKDFLLFLNNVSDLINRLDAIETEQCHTIEQALESTKDI